MYQKLKTILAILLCFLLNACSSNGVPEAGINMTNDANLTMIVDYCAKTLATTEGEGYHELVLYLNETNGEYELHRFDLDVGASEEIHEVYKADQKTCLKIIRKIIDLKLEDYEDQKVIGLDGKEYVVKFKNGDRYYSISTNNIGADKAGILTSIGELMEELINDKGA